jgi:hypothetical protein
MAPAGWRGSFCNIWHDLDSAVFHCRHPRYAHHRYTPAGACHTSCSPINDRLPQDSWATLPLKQAPELPTCKHTTLVGGHSPQCDMCARSTTVHNGVQRLSRLPDGQTQQPFGSLVMRRPVLCEVTQLRSGVCFMLLPRTDATTAVLATSQQSRPLFRAHAPCGKFDYVG